MAKLILLRGNSGSGKTTLARLLQERFGPNTMRISHDMIRMEILHVWGAEGVEKSLPLLIELLRYGRRSITAASRSSAESSGDRERLQMDSGGSSRAGSCGQHDATARVTSRRNASDDTASRGAASSQIMDREAQKCSAASVSFADRRRQRKYRSLRSFSYTRCMAVRFPCTARSSTDDMGRILLSGRPVPAVPVRSAIQYSTRG